MRSPLCQTLCGFLQLRQNATRWQPRSTVGPPVASSSINVCCVLCPYWFVFLFSCCLICFRLYVFIIKLISILSVKNIDLIPQLFSAGMQMGCFYISYQLHYHHRQQRWLCDVFIMSPSADNNMWLNSQHRFISLQ